MKYLFLLFLFLSSPVRVWAQTNLNTAQFTYNFVPTRAGGQIIYAAQNHYFTLEVSGKEVQSAPVNGAAPNQHFITVDKKALQTSVVPLPQPLPPSYTLAQLSTAQQKELLTGYVNYELEYFKNELNVKISGFQQEWRIINGRLFLVWRFIMEEQGTAANPSVGQVYFSAICFNQVLVINLPVTETPYGYEKSMLLAEQVSKSLKTYNQPYPAKK